jgi:hypothetical protein
MTGPIDWRALADSAVGYRTRKRFEPATWDTAPIRLNCINSEIYELEEALEQRGSSAAHSDWPVRYELADIAAYTLTVLRDLGAENWDFRQSFHGGSRRHATPAEITAPLRKYARAAFEFWRKQQPKELLVSLEILLVAVVDVRTRVLGLPGDLTGDVHAKFAASASRPARHGKDSRS